MINLENNIVAFNFERQHGPGSARKLIEMAEKGMLLRDIAREFGISQSLASQKLKHILGMGYMDWRRSK